MPRTLKQYYRAVLVKLGLFQEGAFRLVIDRIYPDDTFLVSFPKSGNTWARFLLANLLSPEKTITFRNVDSLVPDVYAFPEIVNALPRPRYIKVHDAWFDYYPKSIYILRDYRDVLVSYFHYHTALGEFKGDFSTYVRTVDKLHPFGSWKEHVSSALKFHAQHPERMLILRYEDLLRDTPGELRKMAKFCGLRDDLPFGAIAERCTFERLKATEEQHGSLFKDMSGKPFFREGREKQWEKTFSPKDLDMIRDSFPLLGQLGYSVGENVG